MDHFFEESVAGDRGPSEQIKYAIYWAGFVVLLLVALSSAVNIVSFNPESISVNWLSLIFLLISGGLAVLVYRMKDTVYKEYDYVLWNSELEVTAVYNLKRRKKLGTVPLNKVTALGPANVVAGRLRDLKPRNWAAHADKAWCLVYADESGKQAVLLEISDEMRAEMYAANRNLRLSEVKP